MGVIREPAVAGIFYPSDEHALRRMVESFLDRCQVEERVVGGIAPHAGYAYSGRTAGKLYSCFKNVREPTFLILGPSHFVSVKGIAFPLWDYFKTPLGLLEVDGHTLMEFLSQAEGPYYINNRAHLYEHSVEVQLPFLQVLFSKPKIVPAVFNYVEPQYIRELLGWFCEGGYTFIISSDLSHYYPEETARRLDSHCHRGILQKDLKEFFKCEACGREGIEGALFFAREKNLRTHLLEYTTSAEFSGDRRSVVGYGAYLFTS